MNGNSHLFTVIGGLKHRPDTFDEVERYLRNLPPGHEEFSRLSQPAHWYAWEDEKIPEAALPLHLLAQTKLAGTVPLQRLRAFYRLMAFGSRNSLDVRNKGTNTALMLACGQGNVDFAEILLEAGAGSYFSSTAVFSSRFMVLCCCVFLQSSHSLLPFVVLPVMFCR